MAASVTYNVQRLLFIIIEIIKIIDVSKVNDIFIKDCTFPFYADTFSQSCASVCQFGYFQNVAEHKCEKCPSSCLSCVAALNCTACLNGLFMHNG